MCPWSSHQRTGGGDHRLAGTHIALKKSPHRLPASKGGPQFPQNALLGVGQFKAQSGQPGFHPMIIPRASQGRGIAHELAAASLQGELQFDEFVQGQPFPRTAGIGRFRWKMERLNGLGAGWPPVHVQCGMRFRQRRPDGLHHAPDQGAERSLCESLGEWIDRDDAAQVDVIRPRIRLDRS